MQGGLNPSAPSSLHLCHALCIGENFARVKMRNGTVKFNYYALQNLGICADYLITGIIVTNAFSFLQKAYGFYFFLKKKYIIIKIIKIPDFSILQAKRKPFSQHMRDLKEYL